uniref:Uncharacterized protein n=1 Tax=Tanacetum cinerariifolium TaxID=118510 RepID=A0A699L4D6_TANCI|nr:hypothetical protein [Tanacetum cinerariifolium]
MENGLEEILRIKTRRRKRRLDHLKQDQEMLLIKIFSERKKVFRERKKCEKIRAKSSDFLQEMEQYLQAKISNGHWQRSRNTRYIKEPLNDFVCPYLK